MQELFNTCVQKFYKGNHQIEMGSEIELYDIS